MFGKNPNKIISQSTTRSHTKDVKEMLEKKYHETLNTLTIADEEIYAIMDFKRGNYFKNCSMKEEEERTIQKMVTKGKDEETIKKTVETFVGENNQAFADFLLAKGGQCMRNVLKDEVAEKKFREDKLLMPVADMGI